MQVVEDSIADVYRVRSIDIATDGLSKALPKALPKELPRDI